VGAAVEPVPVRDRPADCGSTGLGPEVLLAALSAVDARIEAAVRRVEQGDPDRPQDRFRGLYVSPARVDQLLEQPPAVSPVLLAGSGTDATELPPPLARLETTFGLSGFDIDLLLLALAPDVDLRYERLFGFLNDDLTRRRPTVELALDLLCDSVEAKLRRRRHLLPGAPLLRAGLLALQPPGTDPRLPLLAHLLEPDPAVVGYLLGDPGADRRLAATGELARPAADPAARAELTDVAPMLAVLLAAGSAEPGLLYFHGPAGRGQPAAAAQLAAAWGRPLLRLDLDRSPADTFDDVVRAAVLTADLRGAALYAGPVEAAGDPASAGYRALLAAVTGRTGGPVILAGSTPWTALPELPVGVLTVAFGQPSVGARRRAWQANLSRLGGGSPAAELPAVELDRLAARFRLSADQIAAAVATAVAQVSYSAPDGPAETGGPARVLAAAARGQAGAALERLAQRVVIRHGWDDLVLPAAELTQLRDLATWVDHGPTVLAGWGFDRHVPPGGGVTALFTGPSGAGKTLAAEIVADQLGYDLFRIDLARVVSKYVGETEKNLDAVFTAAADANAVLFFDEADALFGRRSAVQDAHDRYANIEVAYLLQKMEDFDGVAVLATNLRDNLDKAFLRRLAFVINFPFPDTPSRRKIWQRLWPAGAPLAADVDIDLLAGELVLPGGHLRNIAVAAAYRAAGRPNPGSGTERGAGPHGRHEIALADVLVAASREYSKIGQVPPALVAAAQPPATEAREPTDVR
jgi:hypothetical protein